MTLSNEFFLIFSQNKFDRRRRFWRRSTQPLYGSFTTLHDVVWRFKWRRWKSFVSKTTPILVDEVWSSRSNPSNLYNFLDSVDFEYSSRSHLPMVLHWDSRELLPIIANFHLRNSNLDRPSRRRAHRTSYWPTFLQSLQMTAAGLEGRSMLSDCD